MSEHKIFPPSLDETRVAFWVATYAQEFAESYIEGHPNANAFMRLCTALEELESMIIGGGKFYERAEDLHTLSLSTPDPRTGL